MQPDNTELLKRLLAERILVLDGGMGTMLGPVLGAFMLVAMQQYLAQFGQWVTVLHGIIFMICVLVFRRGIVGEIAWRLKRAL